MNNFKELLQIAPYASVIINGIYWAPNSPKLITIPDAKVLLRSAQSHLPWVQTSTGSPPLPHRLLAICDISAVSKSVAILFESLIYIFSYLYLSRCRSGRLDRVYERVHDDRYAILSVRCGTAQGHEEVRSSLLLQ